MALRDSIPARAAKRHRRPKPFGGRFRLPTLRFSGAAMAMSTVVGISLATTWLLNEQQHVGRLPQTSVGASPPEPSPDTSSGTLQAAPVASDSPAPAPSRTVPPTAVGHTEVLRKAQPTSPSATAPTTAPTTATTPPPAATAPTTPPPEEDATPTPSSSPTASPSASAPPTTQQQPPRLGMPPMAGKKPVQPTPEADTALSGTAEQDQLGSGTRHTLVLTVDEQVTALQVEFRLHRPAVLPGITPWTDVPGAVATVSLDRDTLVYRFTLPSGHGLPKGKYSFMVTGGSPEKPTDSETWTASAFALARPRAVTTRGTFAQPVPARTTASR